MGTRVRALRLRGGLTQSQVASRLGFTAAYVSKIERGRGSLPVGTLTRLADALGVPVAAFFEDESAGANGAGSGRLSRGAGREGDGAPTRQQILQAAEELFAEKGYQDASIRDLASRAGCSSANLYHHFRSKYEIFLCLLKGTVELHFAGVHQALARFDHPVDQLRHILVNHLLVQMQRPELRLARPDFHPLQGSDLERFKAERDQYEAALRSVVERGQEMGAFEVDEPKLAVAVALGACNQVNRWYSPEGRLPAEEIARLIAGFLLTGFGARAPVPSPSEGSR